MSESSVSLNVQHAGPDDVAHRAAKLLRLRTTSIVLSHKCPSRLARASALGRSHEAGCRGDRL